MKPHLFFSTATVIAAAQAAGGCASGPTPFAPDVPAGLQPPPGESMFLQVYASGVQIYECAPRSDRPSAHEWVFRAPEATLADRAGRTLGRHYAGPTWESADGSSVVGDVKARDPGPDRSAIPWLLLSAKATAGSGILSATKSIQRVQTAGGAAPAAPCNAMNARQVVRVPYTAIYYFYRAAPAAGGSYV